MRAFLDISRSDMCINQILKGLCHAVQFILFNFANYSPSVVMEFKVSKEITGK